jgi:hypothetical protein
VRVEAHDRKRLEQRCRYITRPALSNQRAQLNAAGQVQLELGTPWRDGLADRARPVAGPFARHKQPAGPSVSGLSLAGRARPVAGPFARHKQSTGLFVSGLSTTHLVMSQLEFMQRLAALVSLQRLHLTSLVSASLQCAK